MKRTLQLYLAVILATAWGGALAAERNEGWTILRWMEKPSPSGPSVEASEEDLARFLPVTSYDRTDGGKGYSRSVASLKAGDVIAYRMPKGEARKAIFTGHLNKVAYRLFRYGHLAIVVEDPENRGALTLLSSESFRGPNTREDLATLADHDWDAYRLDKRERLDQERLREFVLLSRERAGHWYGYDFSGMFGLWNSNLRPNAGEQIGHDYICSTVVAAALHYSGLELDAVQRGGLLDLVTPYQVVTSRGRLFDPRRVVAAEAIVPAGTSR